MSIYFSVPGIPIPQERPFVTRHGTFDRPRSKKAKKVVAEFAQIARAEARTGLFRGKVRLCVYFYGLRPNADLSNALKLVEDACNGVLWLDDKQIDYLAVTRKKMDSLGPRTDVEVSELREI